VNALVEGHGREVAGGTAREQRGPLAVQAMIDQETHMGAKRGTVDRPSLPVFERGWHGDVAPFERSSAFDCIHPIRSWSRRNCGVEDAGAWSYVLPASNHMIDAERHMVDDSGTFCATSVVDDWSSTRAAMPYSGATPGEVSNCAPNCTQCQK